jgi:hypothetical protein
MSTRSGREPSTSSTGRATLYRIYRTTEPATVGVTVSSGCIRMFNQDVVNHYRRMPVDTRAVMLDASEHDGPPTPTAPRIEPAFDEL